MFILSLGFHWFFSKAVAIIPFGFWLIDAVELKKIVRTFLLWITELFFKNFDVGGAHNVPLEGPVMYVTCRNWLICPYSNCELLPCANTN